MNEQTTDNAAALVTAQANSKASAKLILMTVEHGDKVTTELVKGLLPADANMIAQDLLTQGRSVPKPLAVVCDKKLLRGFRADHKRDLRNNTGKIHGALLDNGSFIEAMSPWKELRNGDRKRTITVREPHVKTIEVTSTAQLAAVLQRAKITQVSPEEFANLQSLLRKVTPKQHETADADATPVVATTVTENVPADVPPA